MDHHRALRHGMPEVVFGKGKTPEQIAAIAETSAGASVQCPDHASRCSAAWDAMHAKFPDAEYFPLSGAVRVWRDRTVHGKGKIAVVCAGTSDLFVAEEARSPPR